MPSLPADASPAPQQRRPRKMDEFDVGRISDTVLHQLEQWSYFLTAEPSASLELARGVDSGRGRRVKAGGRSPSSRYFFVLFFFLFVLMR